MARKHKATGLAAFICFTIVLRFLEEHLVDRHACVGTRRDELETLSAAVFAFDVFRRNATR